MQKNREKGSTGVIVAIVVLVLIAIAGYFYLMSQNGQSVDNNTATSTENMATTTEETTATSTLAKNILETAIANPNLTTLVKAAQTANLTGILSSTSTITLFAPTDSAFSKIPKKDLEKLLADKAKLAKVLNYHLVKGDLSLNNIAATSSTATSSTVNALEGGALTIKTGSTTATIGNTKSIAKIDGAFIKAGNGAIFLIDTVLMPK